MSKIIFDCAISLDGYFAGDNRSPQNPMGGVSQDLHKWMFKQKAFWDHIKVESNEEYGADSKIIDEVFARTGAYIMGKRMFDEGEVAWAEDLFEADVYVLTHEKREAWQHGPNTKYHFVNDGIECALNKAKQSANGKDIRIQGGANTIQQFLNAGLIDEFQIHITPIFLGSGLRLFDGIDKDKYDIEILEVKPSELTTHIRYKLVKK